MTARDVVPLPVERRSFLGRRRTDDPSPPAEPPAVERPVTSVVAPAVSRVPTPVPAPVAPPPVAPASEPSTGSDSAALGRAQSALLQAALRQADDLSTALAEEQRLRRQETERLVAENELLRDALAALNAQALQRQQSDDPVAAAAGRLVPEQRDASTTQAPGAGPAAPEPEPQPEQRPVRRRSGREAGPA